MYRFIQNWQNLQPARPLIRDRQAARPLIRDRQAAVEAQEVDVNNMGVEENQRNEALPVQQADQEEAVIQISPIDSEDAENATAQLDHNITTPANLISAQDDKENGDEDSNDDIVATRIEDGKKYLSTTPAKLIRVKSAQDDKENDEELRSYNGDSIIASKLIKNNDEKHH